MRWFETSATTTTPLGESTSTSDGNEKLADVPFPSAKAALPLPASVLTTPRGETSLTTLLPESPTTITPVDGNTATPRGPPRPLASVLTTPRGLTRRMRPFPVSATIISSLEGTTATPIGLLKLAAVPAPSVAPGLPVPASVRTTPAGVMSRTQ